MPINWNDFLTEQALTSPDGQWDDFSQTTLDPLPAMKPNPARKPGQGVEDLTCFDPLFNNTGFDDNSFNPNDYFLSDLEVLQPFGDIVAGIDTPSESSPISTSGASFTEPFNQAQTSSSSSTTPAIPSLTFNQSPQMPNVQESDVQRAQTFSNPIYESLFPNNLDSGLVEDLTSRNGQDGTVHSRPNADGDHEFNPATTTKRNKATTDLLSACWTSPLCPNHDPNGPVPNPSTCNSACGPFLFAPETSLQTSNSNNFLPEPQEVTAEDGVVEIQPRPRKRSESDTSSPEPSTRQIAKPPYPGRIDTETLTLVKNESSQESPAQEHPSAEDGKGKGRRRLPHNQVERKYRESLNTQLESLRRVVPTLQQNQRVCDGADIEDLPTPSKPSKAVILASATAYIKQMEKEKKAMEDENQLLRARMKTLQALVKCEDCSLMQYVLDLKLQPQR